MVILDLQKSLHDISCIIKSYSIYLTGSRCKDCYTDDSDLDLIIVTDYFREMNHDVRRKLVSNIFADLIVHIDPLCLTTIEFEKFKSEISCLTIVPIVRLGGGSDVC